MAVAFDAATSGTPAAATSITVSHTCTGADRYLLVGVGDYVNAATNNTGVTYNAVAMTSLGSASGGGSGGYVKVWGLVNPASGANNIVASFTTATWNKNVAGMSFTGVDQVTSTGTVATATGSSTAPSVTATSETGGMVADVVSSERAGDLAAAAGSGQTERFEFGTTNQTGLFGSTEVGAASVVMDWTINQSQAWRIVAVPLKASGAPSGIAASAIAQLIHSGGMIGREYV